MLQCFLNIKHLEVDFSASVLIIFQLTDYTALLHSVWFSKVDNLI